MTTYFLSIWWMAFQMEVFQCRDPLNSEYICLAYRWLGIITENTEKRYMKTRNDFLFLGLHAIFSIFILFNVSFYLMLNDKWQIWSFSFLVIFQANRKKYYFRFIISFTVHHISYSAVKKNWQWQKYEKKETKKFSSVGLLEGKNFVSGWFYFHQFFPSCCSFCFLASD